MPMHVSGMSEEFLFPLIFLALVAIPMARIFYRAGFSWAWALLVFIPYIGWAVCWIILASREWTWRSAK